MKPDLQPHLTNPRAIERNNFATKRLIVKMFAKLLRLSVCSKIRRPSRRVSFLVCLDYMYTCLDYMYTCTLILRYTDVYVAYTIRIRIQIRYICIHSVYVIRYTYAYVAHTLHVTRYIYIYIFFFWVQKNGDTTK